MGAPSPRIADVTKEQPTERTLAVVDVADLADVLAAFHANFPPLFTRYE